MSTLPEDIIFTEILPRISSVKSLLKFKSVSKPWYSLISSQNFVKTQLDKSLVKNTSLPAIIISSNNRYFAVGHCDVDALFSQQDTYLDHFDIDFPPSYSISAVAGCCNGLHCILLAQKHFILLNLCTRKYHQLPPFSDDYKVFTHFWSNSYFLVSKLYSLKTNSWKTVQGPSLSNLNKGVFLNGKLHWATRIWPYSHMKIQTFDLGSEMAGLVAPPSFAPAKCQFPKWMSVIQGCLCLVHCNIDNVTDVWVMKEYGVKESWCKLLTLPNFGQGFGKAYQVPIPICISQEGEVLVDRDSGFLIYNPITESHKYLKVTRVLDIGIGIQSLVSPFPRGV